MTLSEFGGRLIRSHNYEEKPGLLVEIKRSLEGFTDGDLDRLWDKYITLWLSDKSPRPAHFLQWSVELKVARATDTKGYWLCSDCHTLFEMHGERCPSCKSLNLTVKLAPKTDYAVQVQDNCARCDFYGKKESHGPTCAAWGIQDLDWLPCSTCVCWHCCTADKMWRDDPKSLPDAYMVTEPHNIIIEGAERDSENGGQDNRGHNIQSIQGEGRGDPFS